MSDELTIQEKQDADAEWLGRDLTENEVKYYKFMARLEHQRSGARFLYACAYVECPKVMLQTPIPQAILTMVYGDAAPESMVLEDFTLNVVDLGETVIFTLGAKLNPHGRAPHVDADDLNDWNSNVSGFGFPMSKWITKPQRAARIAAVYPDTGE